MGIVSDLKPCPFCGGKGATEPYYYEGHDEEGSIGERVSYYTRCTKCGVSTPLMSCEESAQDAWEERFVSQPAVPLHSPTARCCMECRHLERVNGRIVEYRCRMTNISFAKYGVEVAPINPKTFYCKFADGKDGIT